MDAKLKKLLKQYDVFEKAENNKLRCVLTKHEVPSRFDDVKTYIETPKFQNAYGVSQIMQEHPDLFEDIGDGFVKCAITGRKIAKKSDDLKRYLNGKSFKEAVNRAQQELNNMLHHEDEDNDEEAGLEDINSDEEMEEEVEDEDDDEDVEADEDVHMSSEKEETPPPPSRPGRKRPVAATGNLKLKPNGRAKKKKN
uniref:Uncharacterized protein n=1 Tax=Panagrolaimus sp. JU765 TaxID=591449 RepID=A0AC34RI33_9BILA